MVQLDNWSVSGLGDSIEIRNPDSVLVQSYSWSTVSECQSISQDENGNWVRNPGLHQECLNQPFQIMLGQRISNSLDNAGWNAQSVLKHGIL